MAYSNPLVSVVIATYNRSNILRYSIESVLNSNLVDWELVIIGDACTDDTADVVAGFDDARIRFKNLENNFGEQSGPNNVGVEISRGEFIAYLNHDDLFFPDHLSSCIDLLKSQQADLVLSQIAIAHPRSAEALVQGDWGFDIATKDKVFYDPRICIPASAWVLRRQIFNTVKGWKPAIECYAESSQEFLFRVWKAKTKIIINPTIGVLAVQSGARPASYSKRDDQESAFYSQQMSHPETFRAKIVEAANRPQLEGERLNFNFRLRRQLKYRFWQFILKIALWAGLSPREVRMALSFGKRGAFINQLREVRGLTPFNPNQRVKKL